jgi:hypothetical protein
MLLKPIMLRKRERGRGGGGERERERGGGRPKLFSPVVCSWLRNLFVYGK